MKITKALFGILSTAPGRQRKLEKVEKPQLINPIMLILFGLLTSCGGSKELYWNDESFLGNMRKGEPVRYYDEANKLHENFFLPDSAIMFRHVEADTQHRMEYIRKDLGKSLSVYYWDVSFLDDKQEPKATSQKGAVSW